MICGSLSGAYEEPYFLVNNSTYFCESQSKFRRNISALLLSARFMLLSLLTLFEIFVIPEYFFYIG
jgi:hypothetical protein